MTRVYTENFESGTNGTAISTSNTTYNAVVGTGCAFYNTSKFQGSFSQKVTVGTAAYGTMTIASTTTHYIRLYFCAETRPVGSACGIASTYLAAGAVHRNSIWQDSAGHVRLYSDTNSGPTSTTVLTVGTWYRLEWDIVGTTMAVRLYLGDSTTALETLSTAAENASFDSVYFGNTPITVGATSQSSLWDAIAGDTAANPGALTTPKSASDTGSGADAASVQNLVTAKSAGDTGTGADAAAKIGLKGTETGAGVETTSIAATRPATETGTGTDTASVAVAFGASESGSFADNASVAAGLFSLSDGDSAAFGEAAAVAISVLAGDTGTFSDSVAVTSTVTTSDSGAFTEATSINRAFGNGDSGTVRDAALIGKSTWRFTPPSYPTVYPIRERGSLFVTINTGYTILKNGGAYQQVRDPLAEDVEAADIAYLGGHSYRVDATEIAALTAAGYGGFVALMPDPS